MMEEIVVLGIDLGKNICSLAGLDASGAVVRRRQMRPESVAFFTKDLPTCVIAMEACCGAHHLARLLTAQGHKVRLMSPEYVRPYVKAQKNDLSNVQSGRGPLLHLEEEERLHERHRRSGVENYHHNVPPPWRSFRGGGTSLVRRTCGGEEGQGR